MSVSSIGTSPFPATLPPLPGQAAKPNGQNATGGANTAANSASNTTTTNAVTNNSPGGITAGGTTGVTPNAANTVNNVTNPLPVQAATTPGTGQKVNIIA